MSFFNRRSPIESFAVELERTGLEVKPIASTIRPSTGADQPLRSFIVPIRSQKGAEYDLQVCQQDQHVSFVANLGQVENPTADFSTGLMKLNADVYDVKVGFVATEPEGTHHIVALRDLREDVVSSSALRVELVNFDRHIDNLAEKVRAIGDETGATVKHASRTVDALSPERHIVTPASKTVATSKDVARPE